MRDGFIKVAAATPRLKVADCQYNAQAIIDLMRQGARQGVKVMCFSELTITGYTCGDLFLQERLLKGAEDALRTILDATAELDLVAAVGLPVRYNCKLFNCAAVICRGELLGLVPKTNLPGYAEFSEGRWFSSGGDVGYALFPFAGEEQVEFSSSLLFHCEEMPLLTFGVEICEDLWVADTPSTKLCAGGATVILNLSASNELAGKARWRNTLISAISGRLACGYVYGNAGWGESTTDGVFVGHDLIAENGVILAQQRFADGLLISELDLHLLAHQRQRMNTFPAGGSDVYTIHFSLEPAETPLTRPIPQNPFVPEDEAVRLEQWEEMLAIAAQGLAQRLAHTRSATAVIGLSGGLDSTLAILIVARAFDLLSKDRKDIIAVTMPCFGTTDRTRDNACILAEELGATLKRIDIGEAVKVHFADIGHRFDDHSVTFENAQARERTQVLMDVANMRGGLVIGTGDLSELALGWCTYNGDHMSMYAVNASIPKTVIRHLTAYVSDAVRAEKPRLSAVLDDILATPVSPELLPAVDGDIAQKTEDLVGPYELHDFFLYHAVLRGCSPRKVYRLALHALSDRFDRGTILKWLKNFYRRFFSQQFKRSCMPDGPKVGPLSLSPRGDWHMPSDALNTLWMEELEEL